MGEIAVLHGIAFLPELLHHCRDGIPDDDGIRDQIETQRLMGKGLPAALPELALVGDDQSRPQVMQRLAFVELAEETAPILGVGVPPQDSRVLARRPYPWNWL
jgi:hypothetical protein